jgi:hypothetical protein
MYMYVCMYVYMYVCMYICMYVCVCALLVPSHPLYNHHDAFHSLFFYPIFLWQTVCHTICNSLSTHDEMLSLIVTIGPSLPPALEEGGPISGWGRGELRA